MTRKMGALFLVVFALGCSKKPTLKALEVPMTSVESTVSTISSGTVEAKNQAVLSFGATGRVKEILVKLGDKVKKDQLLATLDTTEVELIYKDAQKEFKRAQELFKEGLVSKVALDEAKKASEVAKANFDRTILKAPFDGIITELNLQVGELSNSLTTTSSTNVANAATARAPMRIVDMEQRHIHGEIDEIDLAKVKVGSLARMKILSLKSTPLMGHVTQVVPFISTTKEQDRTSEIEILPEKTEELLPVGASADIEIVVASKDKVVAVPTRLVLGTSALWYVYKYVDGKIFKTEIKKGVGNYERTEVVSGISLGDTVVFPGDVELKDGLKVNIEKVPWP